MDENRVLWMLSKTKDMLQRLIRDLEAGMTPTVAYQMAFHDVDQIYRQFCSMEQLPPVNHMLEPTSVEMYARFGLDALFGALKGECNESECRKAFWQVFRRSIRPTSMAQTSSA
jgi:phage terminase large subunit-like protein